MLFISMTRIHYQTKQILLNLLILICIKQLIIMLYVSNIDYTLNKEAKTFKDMFEFAEANKSISSNLKANSCFFNLIIFYELFNPIFSFFHRLDGLFAAGCQFHNNISIGPFNRLADFPHSKMV